MRNVGTLTEQVTQIQGFTVFAISMCDTTFVSITPKESLHSEKNPRAQNLSNSQKSCLSISEKMISKRY